jgi:hypothetical protein
MAVTTNALRGRIGLHGGCLKRIAVMESHGDALSASAGRYAVHHYRPRLRDGVIIAFRDGDPYYLGPDARRRSVPPPARTRPPCDGLIRTRRVGGNLTQFPPAAAATLLVCVIAASP